MSDLSGKFTSFEEQSSAQHTELMEALSTIAFALGAPPTIPGTTLADISTQMTALTDGIALIYEANATFYASMLSLVGAVNTNTDTIITNNSLNAQRTIAAIYATFCDCATDTPLLAPPIDVTPTSLEDEAKCRRIQFYLSVFGNWLNKIANYGASGAAITSGTLSTLLSLAALDAGIVATGAEVGAVAGPPGIVIGAVVGLIAVIVYTLGGSVLIDYANQFNDLTLRDNMVQAMFAATNADEGYIAFKSTLLAGMDTIPAEVMYTLWWSAWSNDVYSGSPTVDDSAFDGTICGSGEEVVFPPITGCVSFDSVETHLSNGQTLQCIVWPGGGTISPASVSGAAEDLTADQAIFGHADLINLWVSSSPGCHCYYNANGTPNFDVSGLAAQFTTTGDYYTMLNNSSTPFTVTLCVDEP